MYLHLILYLFLTHLVHYFINLSLDVVLFDESVDTCALVQLHLIFQLGWLERAEN